MTPLDIAYITLLQVGLVCIRNAAASKQIEWLQAQASLLHEVPTLISEENSFRHEYFRNEHQRTYEAWIAEYASPDVQDTSEAMYTTAFEMIQEARSKRDASATDPRDLE